MRYLILTVFLSSVAIAQTFTVEIGEVVWTSTYNPEEEAKQFIFLRKECPEAYIEDIPEYAQARVLEDCFYKYSEREEAEK